MEDFAEGVSKRHRKRGGGPHQRRGGRGGREMAEQVQDSENQKRGFVNTVKIINYREAFSVL